MNPLISSAFRSDGKRREPCDIPIFLVGTGAAAYPICMSRVGYADASWIHVLDDAPDSRVFELCP